MTQEWEFFEYSSLHIKVNHAVGLTCNQCHLERKFFINREVMASSQYDITLILTKRWCAKGDLAQKQKMKFTSGYINLTGDIKLVHSRRNHSTSPWQPTPRVKLHSS